MIRRTAIKARAVKRKGGLNKHESARLFVLREQGFAVFPHPIIIRIHELEATGKNKCEFEPDLMVVESDGTIWMEDVKANHGTVKRAKSGARDDATVKIKACARLLPLFGWRQVMPRNPKSLYGEWIVREFGGERDE